MKGILVIIQCIIAAGFAIPERIVIPVVGVTPGDWNRKSFWHESWGLSGVHKGIDIFGRLGTVVTSATAGIVLFVGSIARGGNVAVVLGPKWRLHYYAHLNSITAFALRLVPRGGELGTLGDTGNARGTPPHLHYSVVRIFSVTWDIDGSTQGFWKAFYLDPDPYLFGIPCFFASRPTAAEYRCFIRRNRERGYR
ncbi:Peptidase family M23 [Desulfomicrobium norvegicum]|uniref:Peptidase family M23 n=1 Tax=Desulfomicrobium norvegicum (strain DSM 1741 / NCIMB 8310) TaxID=52561 RepID=A0A8G2F776_DESNO|nr:M23 family metallopeptidase [Desulfomicrobium norvegicum]SFM12828.1 Peptidase family M23 [Desulfomicrobium norvegicum]